METEIKLKFKNKKKIVEAIMENGFIYSEKICISDQYFRYRSSKFSNHEPFFRIRKIDNKSVEFTMKDGYRNKDGIWQKRETNIQIDKAEDMVVILKKLHCRLIKNSQLSKEIWSNGKTRIEFIHIIKPYDLKYMEIESNSVKNITKLLKILGDLVEKSGEEIFQ